MVSDRLNNLEPEPDVKETADHWLKRPINFGKVRKHLPKSIAIFSDNDSYVPLDNQDDFKNKLGSKIIVEHNKGHFNTIAGIGTIELPVVLEELLKMVLK